MKILYLDHAPIYGGAEVVLLNLLKQLPDERWQALVGTPNGTPFQAALVQAGIPTMNVNFGRLNGAGLLLPVHLARSVAAVIGIIRRQQISLLHTNTVRAHIVGSLAAALTGTPLVWTLHDNTFPPHLVRWLARVPRRVVCVAQWLADLYGPHGLAAKSNVIYNGVDLAAPLATKGGLRLELGVPQDAPFLVNVGRLVRGKAPHLFIQAAQQVLADHPEVYVALVGGADQAEPGRAADPYPAEVEQAIAASGLGSHLVLTGYRPDTARFYDEADALVYNAVQPEGLPTVILEAMQYGLPVVAAHIGGAAELVQDGVNGWLVPPGDVGALAGAIQRLLADPAGARTLGANGRALVDRCHDIRQQAARYAAIYESILS